MWTLENPEYDGTGSFVITALTNADGSKTYPLTSAELASLLVLYQAYDALLGQPAAALKPSALAACQEAIEDAYGQMQKGRRLAALRGSLLSAAESCPYCGYGDPTELDHYLPKKEFKLLSIYPRNLVPACSACNNAKRAHVADGDANRLIHAYFADLPNTPFLHAEVQLNDQALLVKFSIEATGLDPALAQSLSFQLTRLQLNDRYPKQINIFLFSMRPGMRDLFAQEADAASIATYLERAGGDLAGSFGLNDWRVALLRGLAASPEFCTNAQSYFEQRP